MALNYTLTGTGEPELRDATTTKTAALVDAAAASLQCTTPAEAAALPELETRSYASLKTRHIELWREGRHDDVVLRPTVRLVVRLLPEMLLAASDWETECRCGYPRLRLAVPPREYTHLQTLLCVLHPGDSGCVYSMEQVRWFLRFLTSLPV